ncbi:uncharacterized protein LOC116266219 [Nymphaea colorata]|nr:uncharacterized protein LOC116266219 [Nymphaea colorata]
MKSPVCSCLSKMLQRLAKSEEQGKKGACYREPSVLVTLYVVKPWGSHNADACRPTGRRRRHRHRQGIRVQTAGTAAGGGGGDGGGGYNRRQELLRYCRHLRTSAASQPLSPPPPHQSQRSPPRLHLPNEPQRHDQGKRRLRKMLTSLKKMNIVH